VSNAPQPDLAAIVAEAVARTLAARPLFKTIAVSIGDAARLLGFSENHFRSRVLPDLPVIRGSRPRVLVADIERWADEHKAFATSGAGGSGLSGSGSTSSATNTRRASKPSPRHAARAKRLLERASKSMRPPSKASA
jgi:hypothetical protein